MFGDSSSLFMHPPPSSFPSSIRPAAKDLLPLLLPPSSPLVVKVSHFPYNCAVPPLPLLPSHPKSCFQFCEEPVASFQHANLTNSPPPPFFSFFFQVRKSFVRCLQHPPSLTRAAMKKGAGNNIPFPTTLLRVKHSRAVNNVSLLLWPWAGGSDEGRGKGDHLLIVLSPPSSVGAPDRRKTNTQNHPPSLPFSVVWYST